MTESVTPNRLGRAGSARGLRRLVLAGCVAVYGTAAAHPHIWVTYDLVLQMSGNALVAVREQWVFGPEFPLASLLGPKATIPSSGPLDARATDQLRQQAFASLASDAYFTHGFADGKPIRFEPPQQFVASVENGRLAYSFLMRLTNPLDVSHNRVSVGVWDDSFFVDANPESIGAIRFVGSATKSCAANSYRDAQHAIYGGLMLPIAIRITC
jgi:ABC-type uncharacterized transport system substrate-binding protein